MPTIYDNIKTHLSAGLTDMLTDARRADFCVGYFNLRGWGVIADKIEELRGENNDYCRLLIGMTRSPEDIMRTRYSASGETKTTQEIVNKNIEEGVERFVKQLTYGVPTAADERNLRELAKQLRSGKVRVKFHGRHPLHAKLYLIHRQDKIAALTGFVGSSNLTLSGMEKNGELNVDVLEQDAAKKLAEWFEERWNDKWSPDVSEDIANIIENSWANGPVEPYHIYLKTAYELSQQAIAGEGQYPLPDIFRDKILEFQAHAVSLAAKFLDTRNGVIVGDVVGLGKTMIASAIAKTFQDDQGDNVLIVCPPKLIPMWEDYTHRYRIASKVLSSGALKQLEELRRYKLVIVDESHNFRNRDTTRHAQLRDYIAANDSRVILLTATPYNKAFADIASQLRLFLKSDEDLGIQPDNHLRDYSGGIAKFKGDHPNSPITSLAAFEKSDYIDDWRDLMRHFMVRRTRGHIIRNYAKKDDNGRSYLLFANGEKFYFPDRKPLRLDFKLNDDSDDDYARLYSPKAVDIINDLKLPRYGLKEYVPEGIFIPKSDKQIMDNLSRAGTRLRGFARSGLFKRLESGGETFLISIRRHIIRNAVFYAALEAGDELPIGQIFSPETDEVLDESDNTLFSKDNPDIRNWTKIGANVLRTIRKDKQRSEQFHWVSGDYFHSNLRTALKADNENLLKFFDLVPEWQPAKDRKLNALHDLLQKKHSKDKVLIFTQYADTAHYLHRELQNKGVKKIAVAVGGDNEDILSLVKSFSPESNGETETPLTDLRVLVATDVLSEGQNLQDAHIIVNYDLPWAIIRLVQRAGRVDRIGQKKPEILCYSALPEDGIESIIDLRRRLRDRMKENSELVGSDERFFESDEKTHEKDIRDLYSQSAKLDEPDDETDLVSRAYDIWRQAILDDPDLAEKITEMPNVVYSAKAAKENGVIAYIKDERGNDILAQLSTNGKVLSQSQSHLLDLLECAADEPTAQPADNHHEIVAKAVIHSQEAVHNLGGQLGGKNSPRHTLYMQLESMQQQVRNAPLLSSEELREAVQEVYDRPLTERARIRIGKMIHRSATDEELQQAALELKKLGILCVGKDDMKKTEPHIICSMGLVKKSNE